MKSPLTRSLVACLALLAACVEPIPDVSEKYFSPTYSRLRIRTHYIVGAEPVTGSGRRGHDIWDLLRVNLQALLEQSPKTIVVPSRLDQMNALPTTGRQTWTGAQLEELMSMVTSEGDDIRERVIHVFFVGGFYKVGGTIAYRTVGLQIAGTPAIVVFKDAIRTVSDHDPAGFLGRYLEQSTIVHEIGHVLGLVANGAPVTSEHEDPVNRGHCVNETCVMHFENDGGRAAAFLERLASDADLVLFDEACLDDARAAAALAR